MNRPYLNTRYWGFRDLEGNEIPGVGLFHNRTLHAHLTYNEARKLADKLHDMADKLEARQEGTN